MFYQVVWLKICFVINSIHYMIPDLPVTLSLTSVWTLSYQLHFSVPPHFTDSVHFHLQVEKMEEAFYVTGPLESVILLHWTQNTV